METRFEHGMSIASLEITPGQIMAIAENIAMQLSAPLSVEEVDSFGRRKEPSHLRR